MLLAHPIRAGVFITVPQPPKTQDLRRIMVIAADTDRTERPTRVFVGITVLEACAYLGTDYPHGSAGYAGAWAVVSGLAIWRLWRGGSSAWTVLIALNTCALILCALAVAGVVSTEQGNVWLALRSAAVVAELALLLHPSVRKYVK